MSLLAEWVPNQQNLIKFVLVDNDGDEVIGLGGTFSLSISKGNGPLVAGAGSKGELGLGWYTYLSTADEADTVGSIAVAVTGPGVRQQNLEYVVRQRNPYAVPFEYTMTDDVSGDPLTAVKVTIATQSDGGGVVWVGFTDSFGVARDEFGELPWVDPGTYYLFRQKPGYEFNDPDEEVVA